MGIVVIPTYGSDPATVTAANLDAKVSGLGTEFNGNIDNDNIKSSAAIANSKLNLTTVSQAVTVTGGLTVSTTALTMSSMPLNEAKGSDIASASAPNITSATGNTVHITGTTTITSFATATAGVRRILIFDGALTFTHNATSLILPTGANITTVAGDTCVMVSEGSGNWRCTSYQRKDGTALAATAITASSQAQMEAATDNTTTVTPARVNFNPGVAKAWVRFDGTGTPTVAVSHNVDSSITDNGTGDYTVAWTTDFSSANYCVVGMAKIHTGPNETIINFSDAADPAAGTCRIETVDGGLTNGDPTIVCLAAFGDQ